MSTREPVIAVIGGSGLYDLDLLRDPIEIRPDTPYGETSDAIIVGTLQGRSVAFLSRHGRGHKLTPAEIPAAANIYALKALGVRRVVSVSAVGSLREDYPPGDLVVPDQIIDRTSGARRASFFGGGVVAHVGFADPFCPHLRASLLDAAGQADARAHASGTYVCIEGPRFSTRAESELYRAWHCDVIGMTAMPEAVLAREAELCYATLALVTDYDCWRAGEEAVDARTVTQVMAANVAAARRVVTALAGSADPDRDCACHHALASAVMTRPDRIEPADRERLAAFLGAAPRDLAERVDPGDSADPDDSDDLADPDDSADQSDPADHASHLTAR